MSGKKGRPARLNAAQLRDWLAFEEPAVCRVALALRRMVLKAAPRASEAMKFRCPCYFRAGAFLGAIGGNICVIEVKRGKVLLSFIMGVGIADPHGLLRGKGKAKRFVPVASVEEASQPRLAALVRAAAKRAETSDQRL